jgi:hypothetical protein
LSAKKKTSKKSLPKSVKIGGYTYKIVPRKTRFKWHEDEEGFLTGAYDPKSLEIHLATDRNDQAIAESLLHETLHSIWNLFNLPEHNEEDMVIKLTGGLLMLLKDNPQLVKYIQDGR